MKPSYLIIQEGGYKRGWLQRYTRKMPDDRIVEVEFHFGQWGCLQHKTTLKEVARAFAYADGERLSKSFSVYDLSNDEHIKALAERPVDTSILTLNAQEMEKTVNSVSDEQFIRALQETEETGKNRLPVVHLLRQRRQILGFESRICWLEAKVKNHLGITPPTDHAKPAPAEETTPAKATKPAAKKAVKPAKKRINGSRRK